MDLMGINGICSCFLDFSWDSMGFSDGFVIGFHQQKCGLDGIYS
jgi:hypothetical protein